ncbi:F0F1 ATP synthase subunit delta [Paenibacillus albiflavus]|uniref:ATP synthase subunit delta n=1 Tax=Paenibacillus albiflavus TaxID=2545760 RepID=A0A4R4DYY9_9BACL|nr:F0F1 ATP synthase subunit delta [Paenibacillus albiflavus]TCZ69369.1 F0F1 ATP synthase subunit delta [Paenibacillus albiflavus]
MSDIVVAKRYAKALFELAQEKGVIAQYQSELQLLVDAVKDNADLGQIIGHPNIDFTRKSALIDSIFEGKLSVDVLQTLKLLIQRGREGILSTLLLDYVQISNDVLGQANATVYTPFAISDAQQQEIATEFSKITGKTVYVKNVIEPSLLGGIQVRIGNRVYDASFSSKLERLRKTMISSTGDRGEVR